MAREKWYVGLRVEDSGRDPFESDVTPTKESHPQYRAAIGPFRTKRAALLMASPLAWNNPHLSTVADAERIARRESIEIKKGAT